MNMAQLKTEARRNRWNWKAVRKAAKRINSKPLREKRKRDRAIKSASFYARIKVDIDEALAPVIRSLG